MHYILSCLILLLQMPKTHFKSCCKYAAAKPVVCLLPVFWVWRHHVAKQRARARRSSPNSTSNSAACEIAQKTWEKNVFDNNSYHHADEIALTESCNFASETEYVLFAWVHSSHYCCAGRDQRQPNCSPGSLGEWAFFSKVTSYYVYLFNTKPPCLFYFLVWIGQK